MIDLNRAVDYLKEWAENGLFGEVLIKFEHGRIVFIKIIRNIKNEDDLLIRE